MANSLRKGFARTGDVLLSHKATLGRTALLGPISSEFVVLTPQVTYYRVLKPDVLYPPFLKYYFDSQPFQDLLTAWSGGGSTRAYIGITEQLKFPILLPPISDQREIADCLSAFDAKIEIERKLMATLESIIRAIFSAWFIEFDQVPASLERPDSKGACVAATSSPLASIEERPIPRGWRVGRLGDVSVNERRGISYASILDHTPYIGLEHMPRRSIALTRWDNAMGLESNKSQFRRGEILFGKLRPYFHKVGIAPVSGVCSTDILVVRGISDEWSSFVLGHLISDALIAHTDRCSTGTKMPRASWDHIADFKVVIPTRDAARELHEIVSPISERIISGVHASREAASLRDLLLPKLLSGELPMIEANSLLRKSA